VTGAAVAKGAPPRAGCRPAAAAQAGVTPRGRFIVRRLPQLPDCLIAAWRQRRYRYGVTRRAGALPVFCFTQQRLEINGALPFAVLPHCSTQLVFTV